MVVGYGYGLAGIWGEERGAVRAEPKGEGDVREWEVKKPCLALMSRFCVTKCKVWQRIARQNP